MFSVQLFIDSKDFDVRVFSLLQNVCVHIVTYKDRNRRQWMLKISEILNLHSKPL